MNRPTAEQRLALVRTWLRARETGETQLAFCRRQEPPLSPRSLRAWVKEGGLDRPALDEVRDLLRSVVAKLAIILATMEPEPEPEPPSPTAPAAAPSQAIEEVPARQLAVSPACGAVAGHQRFKWEL